MAFSFRLHGAGGATTGINSLDAASLFAGVGAFLLWISVVKYLEWRAEVPRNCLLTADGLLPHMMLSPI